jgi:hypothetical protein
VNINSYKSWEDAHGNRPLGTVAGWTDVKGGVCFVCNICNVCIEHAFVHCLYNEKMIKNITKSSLLEEWYIPCPPNLFSRTVAMSPSLLSMMASASWFLLRLLLRSTCSRSSSPMGCSVRLNLTLTLPSPQGHGVTHHVPLP